jgi:glutamate dehydrogenase
VSDIARAYTIAREVFGMRPMWGEIEALDNQVAAETQMRMLLEGRRLIERGTRWLLRNRRQPLDIAATVEHFEPGATTLYESVSRLLDPAEAAMLGRKSDELQKAGVPRGIAMRVASLPTMIAALDIVEVATDTGLDVDSVAAVHFRLGSRLELHWLRDRIGELPRNDRWGALARAALRDDLYTLHRALTAEVLRSGPAELDADARVRAWVAANPAAERCIQTLDDIRVGHVFDMTTLPVAVREVRNLLQAPASASAEAPEN